MTNPSEKKFILDSSSLITISDNCFIKVLKHLAEREQITFIIPKTVYEESVTTPLNIKRFELSAIRIKDAIEEGYIKIAKQTPSLLKRLEQMQQHMQRLCECEGREIRLIHRGELETLALLKEENADVLVIDERTTRMLIEEPEQLYKFLKKRHGCNILLDNKSISALQNEFRNLKIFRSVELIALAYEDGSLEKEIHKSKQALQAALYAAKFAGCAVSFEEISRYLSKVRA